MRSILLLSTFFGSTDALDRLQYLVLHKKYYAKRHGYKFMNVLTNPFLYYYPAHMWEVRRDVGLDRYRDGGIKIRW